MEKIVPQDFPRNSNSFEGYYASIMCLEGNTELEKQAKTVQNI